MLSNKKADKYHTSPAGEKQNVVTVERIGYTIAVMYVCIPLSLFFIALTCC